MEASASEIVERERESVYRYGEIALTNLTELRNKGGVGRDRGGKSGELGGLRVPSASCRYKATGRGGGEGRRGESSGAFPFQMR